MLDTGLFYVFLFNSGVNLYVRNRLTKSILQKCGRVQQTGYVRWRWWCERSMQIVGFCLVSAILLGYGVPGTVSHNAFLKVFGAVMLTVSVALHLRAKYDLGINWTNAVLCTMVMPGLITQHGLYKYSRNPMYTATLGMVFGAVFMTQNLFVVCLWIALLVYFEVIIRSEEILLRAHKGDKYVAYCKRVPRYL